MMHVFCYVDSFTYMSTSRVCPAGLECPAGMTRQPDLIRDRCRIGYYCPAGNVQPLPQPCPGGTYNAETGRMRVSDCVQCTPGKYCYPSGLSQPAGDCPGGYYCPLGTAESNSFPCPIGFYRNGSAKESFEDCTECISGYYCDREGLAQPIACPPGYFCVSGSTFPQPCPLGTYSNSTGLRRSTDCTPCPGGYYCDGIGRTAPTGLCDPGFYCREKAYSSAPPEGATGGLCPAGGYCPRGSATPTPCIMGYYSKSAGAKSNSDCVPCDPGYFCAGSSSTAASEKCSAGYYCIGGADKPTQHDTPAGYFTLQGAFKPEPCPRGQYQPASRSSSCLQCPQGYYCNGTGTVNEVICPKGHYCPLGSEQPTPCPRGTMLNQEGRFNLTHCNNCTAGYACDSVGTAIPTTRCHPGYYCLEGSDTSMPQGSLCPEGYYCPEGTADYIDTPCGNGTYSNYSGMSDISECIPCDPGKACTGLALTKPNGVCAAGYFCRRKATTTRPRDGGSTGDLCVSGSYCPEGTGEPKRCEAGSFSNTTGLAACYGCPPGFYCVDGENALRCPQGRYCPGNNTAYQPMCPTGTYNPVFGEHHVLFTVNLL